MSNLLVNVEAVDGPDHVGLRVSQGAAVVFVLCRKDAFCDRWYVVAEVGAARRTLKEYAEFESLDDAAQEAARLLFDLTKRFTPAAYRELFEEVRTPETVLRAMLRAYERATLEAISAFYAADPASAAERAAWDHFLIMETLCNDFRRDVGAALCGKFEVTAILSGVGADYRARLAGERPLDAPPLEVTP